MPNRSTINFLLPLQAPNKSDQRKHRQKWLLLFLIMAISSLMLHQHVKQSNPSTTNPDVAENETPPKTHELNGKAWVMLFEQGLFEIKNTLTNHSVSIDTISLKAQEWSIEGKAKKEGSLLPWLKQLQSQFQINQTGQPMHLASLDASQHFRIERHFEAQPALFTLDSDFSSWAKTAFSMLAKKHIGHSWVSEPKEHIIQIHVQPDQLPWLLKKLSHISHHIAFKKIALSNQPDNWLLSLTIAKEAGI